ncbi:golvesin C-terminal-like domain-containing protein [Acrocarpospora phusangensis]|uniref:golvesin C-terminal-like domain-containing protein n=1 Tax=Acrocarpospora phusangensis TaxID=1070424 RepID=UPI00194E973F|nr:GDSL-type esterase/lipase family protein [Acrocarpospora phusangensis]
MEKPAVPAAERDGVLGTGWRSSKDLAWTTVGDAAGLHLLTAEADTGYAWRTIATLKEPGFETDQWIGNVCLTGSGKRAVVVYAPRQFTNRDLLFERGGFTAVVDLSSGSVTKLGVRTSLAYHNPGCGTGETAVLNQGGTDLGRTRLHLLDTAKARLGLQVELPGQVTSAIPVNNRIVASYREGLTEITPQGGTRLLAATKGPAAYLRADASDGLVYLEVFLEAHDAKSIGVARRYRNGTVTELARGPLTEIGLAAGTQGRVFLTGTPTSVATLPATVSRIQAPASAEISTEGQVALTHEPTVPGALSLKAQMQTTGRTADFRINVDQNPLKTTGSPDPTESVDQSPLRTTGSLDPSPLETTGSPNPSPLKATGSLDTQTAGSPSDPVEEERTCGVARNDPHLQVLQPQWKQVEWAANLAVVGALTVARPYNWNESGLPEWTPQGRYPSIPLRGGGRVPAQILLGVLAQESNLWQASNHVLEGEFGNPLIGDYYGRRESPDGWGVHWDKADCGYGVAQVTDRMRRGQRDELDQKRIAVDYATNIAAGLQILQEKWNATFDHMKMNNADPRRIENWFAAVWAYNTGIQPRDASFGNPGCTPGPTCTDPAGNWGLGWLNNPINPNYPINRGPFLEYTQDDARNPQLWPYPEKVIGWAAHPIIKSDFRKPNNWYAAYNQAWWTTGAARIGAKPPLALFCDTSNHCDPTSASPCQLREGPYADRCWWNRNAVWKNCAIGDCGNENMRFPTTYPEPQFALTEADVEQAKMPTAHYKPNCRPYDTLDGAANAAPPGALIVDDVSREVVSPRPGCGREWQNSGVFTLDFAADRSDHYPSKIDFHQVGGGLGGHFWFAHARQPDSAGYSSMKVTGTWTLNESLHGWARVLVHLPDHGAHTQAAKYRIDLGDGTTKERHLQQRTQEHRWVSLGAFLFDGTPSVSLSNMVERGDDVEDVAWDAIAFQPLPHKPFNMIAVLGDSIAAGEGASTDEANHYYKETNSNGGGNWAYNNACHRSKFAWARLARAADNPGESLGSRHDRWDPNLDLQHHACSGARTRNLLPSTAVDGERITDAWGNGAAGRHREPSQLDKGFLDEHTTQVFLTVGANDARWSDVVRQCVASLPSQPTLDCQDTQLDGDPQPLRDTVPGQLDQYVIPSIETVIRAINKRAPNASIIVMGYPRLISGEGQCALVGGTFWLPVNGVWREFAYGLTPREATWLNEMADLFAGKQRELTIRLALELGIPIVYGDPRPEFDGKAVCGDPESIHRGILKPTAGEPQRYGSQQSFHPTIQGANLYANTLTAILL